MTTPYTPGPWFILEVMGKKFVAANMTDDHPYKGHSRFIDVCGDEDYPRKDADLQLSAAAPDMAQALQRAVNHAENGDDYDWVGAAEAALEKAGAKP